MEQDLAGVFSGIFSAIPPGLVLAMVSVSVLQLLLFVVAAVSLVRKNVPNGDKILWLLLILLGGILGSVIYLAIGSAKLDEKAAEDSAPQSGRR